MRKALLAQRTGLAELVDERVHLQAHGAHGGSKALTVIGSMLAGGDSIDDTIVLRTGATGELFNATCAPSTVGTWLRSFRWYNIRQLDAVSRELLARLWAAGGGPKDLAGPLTIDLDSTIVPVYGRGKQGAAFGYTKVRGYHPQLATCPETGQVLFCRLRGGNAGAARGEPCQPIGYIRNRIVPLAAQGPKGAGQPPGRHSPDPASTSPLYERSVSNSARRSANSVSQSSRDLLRAIRKP
ncbi:transposase [Streptomyces sp. NPDC007148]|uniref:transposase n=1 Tax=Streptomyces sp. NPDC007148 TaxID=3364775 RepID=UPI003682163D